MAAELRPRTRVTRVLAAGLCGLAMAELAAVVVVTLTGGISFASAVGTYTVTNGAMGLAFGACGLLLAWHRPRHPIGWLFLAAGVAEATRGRGDPVSPARRPARLARRDAPAARHAGGVLLAVGGRAVPAGGAAAVPRRPPGGQALALGDRGGGGRERAVRAEFRQSRAAEVRAGPADALRHDPVLRPTGRALGPGQPRPSRRCTPAPSRRWWSGTAAAATSSAGSCSGCCWPAWPHWPTGRWCGASSPPGRSWGCWCSR